MMTVEQQNLAHRAVSALEGIKKGLDELHKDFLDVHGMREVKQEKPHRFEVGHSSLLTKHASRPPDPHQWTAILSLLDAIDAVYLTKDNTYGDLDNLVAEKMQTVKSHFQKEK
jgi:hypothetical protein